MENVIMWVGIQNKTARANKTPIRSIRPSAIARPARMGIPPEMPPQTMLQQVRRFSQIVYMATSKKRPADTINPYNGLIRNDQLTPAIEQTSPTQNAWVRVTFAVANGRLCVPSI